MVLVLQSPATYWSILCRLHQVNYLHHASTTWQAINQVQQDAPIFFGCFSEYAFFVLLTIILTTIKTASQLAWLPIIGLILLLEVLHDIIKDPDGRSLSQIFWQPTCSIDIYDTSIPSVPHFSSARHSRINRKRFPGIS